MKNDEFIQMDEKKIGFIKNNLMQGLAEQVDR